MGSELPVGATPTMGAIATGLGEIYWYTVQFEHPDGQGAEVRDGEPGWQSKSYPCTFSWDNDRFQEPSASLRDT